MMQDVSSIVQVYLCLFISSLIFIHDFLFASLFQTINNKTNQNKIPIHVLFRQDILKISTNNILFFKKNPNADAFDSLRGKFKYNEHF